MVQPPLTKTVGVCCGLAAFAIALMVGLSAGNPVEVILSRSLIALFVCYLIGMTLGAMFDRLAAELGAANERENPTPVMDETSATGMPTKADAAQIETAAQASAA